jgi:hypothetical protein
MGSKDRTAGIKGVVSEHTLSFDLAVAQPTSKSMQAHCEGLEHGFLPVLARLICTPIS